MTTGGPGHPVINSSAGYKVCKFPVAPERIWKNFFWSYPPLFWL